MLDADSTYWDLIVQRAEATPDRPFLADDGDPWLDAAGFRDRVERVAAGLLAAGVQTDHTVSWQLPTTLDACLLMAALARLGVRQNPIIHILRRREVGFITAELESDVLITPGVWNRFDFGAMAEDIADHADQPMMVLDVGDGLPEAEPTGLPDAATLDPDTPRWVYYTSGSTGDPKGALHSDRTLIGGSRGFVYHVGIEPDDVFPCAFPLTHIGGICFLVGALRAGSRMVLFDTFDVVETPLAMARHGATILGSAVPFFQAYLAAQERHGSESLYPDLRVCAAGGAPTPPEMHAQLRDQLGAGLVNGWGLTEFPIATFSRTSDPDDARAETVGPAVPGIEVKVIGLDGVDHTNDGGEGELRVDGPQKMFGYIDDSLNAAAFDEDGYFRSGDLGTIDADGFIRVTGRLKDIIIRKAENISALEVENALHPHPAIEDVAVIGLPDAQSGERVCAVVTLAEGYDQLTLQDLAEHCRSLGLANQKIPEQIEIVPELVRNPAGKLVKHEIRAALLARSAESA